MRIRSLTPTTDPELELDPRGLRRTLVKEFTVRKLYSASLQLYRGHKPESFSSVDWNHYRDRLEFNPDAVREMFLEDVVGPLNDWTIEAAKRWLDRGGKVIQLRA